MEYLSRYQSLRKRAEVHGIDLADHVSFAEWLCARKVHMTASYFRKVRASALYGLDREGGQAARDAEAMLRAETSADTSRTPSRAPRAKGIRFEEYVVMLRALAERAAHSRNAFIALCWVMSSRAVGLRPVEWATAVISKDNQGRPILVVQNAKRTNGRSHGTTRMLGLWHIWPSERSAIALLLQEIEKVGPTGFGALHRATVDLLYDLNRQLWPGRREIIGLYSCRHQVAADAKATYSRRETAALMGHRNTRTAGLHYAPRNRAEVRRSSEARAALPVPDPRDVGRVQVHRHDGPPGPRSERARRQR